MPLRNNACSNAIKMCTTNAMKDEVYCKVLLNYTTSQMVDIVHK